MNSVLWFHRLLPCNATAMLLALFDPNQRENHGQGIKPIRHQVGTSNFRYWYYTRTFPSNFIPSPSSFQGPAPGRGVAAESLRAGSARGAAAQRHSRGAAEPTLGRTPGAPGGGMEDAEGVQKCRGTLANKLSTFVFWPDDSVWGVFSWNVCIYTYIYKWIDR